MLVRAALFTSLLIGGCAHAIDCPKRGGPAWTEWSSEHFTVRTDLDELEGRAFVVRLERSRAALLAAAWRGSPTPPGRVPVIVLRQRSELARFAHDSIRGFVTSDLIGQRMMVVSDEGRREGEVVLRHEIAHLLAGAFLLRQPHWLAEGLATFLETIRLDEETGKAVLGYPPEWALRQLGRRSPMSVEGVLAWKKLTIGRENADRYATSWLLVHYLLFERGAGFSDFQRRLMRAEDPELAFKAAFPELDLEELDEALLEHLGTHLKSRTWPTFAVALPGWEGEIAGKPLSDAEVHATWAQLYLAGPDEQPAAERRKLADAEVEEAVREEPTNVSALLATRLLKLPPPERIARARAAAAAHPDDWRGQLVLARVLGGDDEAAEDKEIALRRAVELAPNNARALVELARHLVRRKAFQQALPLALRSSQLSPGNPGVLATVAAAYAGVGRCDEASATLRRAIDALGHESDGRLLGRLNDELKGLASCRAP